jgi:hypothetical protein
MTKDDIIRLAREAGFGIGYSEAALTLFERFAQLVAEQEKESIAAWVEPQRNDIPATGAEFARAIRARTT